MFIAQSSALSLCVCLVQGAVLGTPGAVPGALGAVVAAHGVLLGTQKSAKHADFGWCCDPQHQFSLYPPPPPLMCHL